MVLEKVISTSLSDLVQLMNKKIRGHNSIGSHAHTNVHQLRANWTRFARSMMHEINGFTLTRPLSDACYNASHSAIDVCGSENRVPLGQWMGGV